MKSPTRRNTESEALELRFALPIEALHAGLYIASAGVQHPARTLDSHELIFVRSGVLELGEEESRFRVQAGQTLLLRAHRRHFSEKNYPRDLSFFWIHFRLLNARKSRAQSAVEICVPRIATPSRPTRLMELWGQYLNDQNRDYSRHPAAELLILQMLCESGFQLSTSASPVAESPVAARLLAGRAEAFIMENLQKNLTASRVANALQVSTDYLNRAFRATRGVTTTEWIQNRRIEEARSLLREGAWNVSQVAQHCGFPSAAYFSRLFKRQTGLNPLEFRKMYASTHINRH
jgi:AraC-like DNA-binding protein